MRANAKRWRRACVASGVTRLSLAVVLIAVGTCAASTRHTEPLPDCVLTFDPGGKLDVQDPADRLRLADELERVDVIAARFRERIRSDTAVAPTRHARITHATRADRAYWYCETILREQLVKEHAIEPADLLWGLSSDRALR